MERKYPLFIVTGSSGSGKTYVLSELRKIMPGFVAFDLDNLRGFIDYNDWQKALNVYVRFARDIAQSGVMTILCGTDDHPCLAKDAYGFSKAMVEELTRYFHRNHLGSVVPDESWTTQAHLAVRRAEAAVCSDGAGFCQRHCRRTRADRRGTGKRPGAHLKFRRS